MSSQISELSRALLSGGRRILLVSFLGSGGNVFHKSRQFLILRVIGRERFAIFIAHQFLHSFEHCGHFREKFVIRFFSSHGVLPLRSIRNGLISSSFTLRFTVLVENAFDHRFEVLGG
jgi:hypothetical protein